MSVTHKFKPGDIVLLEDDTGGFNSSCYGYLICLVTKTDKHNRFFYIVNTLKQIKASPEQQSFPWEDGSDDAWEKGFFETNGTLISAITKTDILLYL